jgi:hypothetical protein
MYKLVARVFVSVLRVGYIWNMKGNNHTRSTVKERQHSRAAKPKLQVVLRLPPSHEWATQGLPHIERADKT